MKHEFYHEQDKIYRSLRIHFKKKISQAKRKLAIASKKTEKDKQS
jgi:hypothetical protein